MERGSGSQFNEVVGLADRILLCVPSGGLNDTLCQIEKCWRYAERFTRQLVIDTRRSGLMGQFSDYLSALPDQIEVVGSLEPYHLAVLNELDCYPEVVRGRLTTYQPKRVPLTGWVERKSGVLVSFDFERDYSHSLLVHAQSGGGRQSFDLLKRVSLAQGVARDVSQRLSLLPQNYLGVHVRNTDYQTDYETFFRKLWAQTDGKTVLVCSDDPQVVTRASEIFDRATVITTGNPRIEGQADLIPLHRAHARLEAEGQRTQTLNALTDLLALGGASELFFAKHNWDRHSGFSVLADAICKNKSVITSLLSPPPFSLEAAQRQLDRARASNARLVRDIPTLEKSNRERIAELEEKLQRLAQRLAAMRNSWSWKITWPLRHLKRLWSNMS